MSKNYTGYLKRFGVKLKMPKEKLPPIWERRGQTFAQYQKRTPKEDYDGTNALSPSEQIALERSNRFDKNKKQSDIWKQASEAFLALCKGKMQKAWNKISIA